MRDKVSPPLEEPEPGQKPGGSRARTILAFLLVLVFVYVGVRHFSGELHRIKDVAPSYLLLMLALILVMRVVMAEITRITLHELDCRVPLLKCIYLSFARTYSNLVLPKTGFAAVGIYLKRIYKLSYARYSAFILPNMVLNILASSLVGLAALLLLSQFSGIPLSLPLAAIFLVAVIGCLIVMLPIFPLPPEGKGGRLLRSYRNAVLAWRSLSGNHRFTLQVCALQILMLLLGSLKLYLAFRSIGLEVHYLAGLAASVIGRFGMIFNLTPGGFGFREAGMTFSLAATGVDPETALVATLIDRIIITATSILLGSVCSWKLYSEIAAAKSP